MARVIADETSARSRMTRIRGGALGLLAGLLLAGGIGAAAIATREPPATEVTITLRYSAFEPADLTVPAGTPVRFTLVNEDPIDHEWIVGDAAVHDGHRTGTEPHHGVRPTEVSVPALGTVETVVVFEDPGTYAYVCHLPGHEAYGMVGKVRVVEG